MGKLELKDDPEKTGSYTMTFNVNNMTRNALFYNVTATLLRPATETVDSAWGERTVMLDSDVEIRQVDLGTVTVPAMTTGSFANATFSATVTLTGEEKSVLDELFENGTYIEGFITLTDAAGEAPDLGLPFLAFYGDWTTAPILDRSTWLDEAGTGSDSYLDNECTWWSTIMGYFDGYSFYNLGQNPFDAAAVTGQTVYKEENITISPTGVFQSINDYELYQLREAKLMVVEVRDAQTNDLYYRDYAAYQFKTYYDSSYGVPIPSSLYYFTGSDWDGTDLNGNVLPSGTDCIYTVTAYGAGDYPTVYSEALGRYVTDVESVIPGENEPTFNGHPMDTTGDTLSFHVRVDTEAPKLVNNAVTISEEDGRVYLTGSFVDDGSIASVEVYPQVTRTYADGYGDPSYSQTSMDYSNPFYSEMIYDAAVNEWTFKADVTEYVHVNESYSGENRYYNFEWTGNVFVFGGDYGGNDRGYAVAVKGNTGEGLLLSQTSARLHVGNEFELSVINNTGSDAGITRTSSNPEVATIDEYGKVVALTPGQTTITVSNGASSATCIVAVEEYPTEVLDFDLSIDHFSGLKPDGAIVVKVTNLYPADVVLDEIRWEVYEDEETAEFYEGMITCSQYTSDGLSAEVYLSYDTSTDTEIPGGSGYLNVTLNGVTRTMTLDWEDLYNSYSQDGLLSANSYDGDQTVYVTMGETATLAAKYRQTHSFIPVELYTAVGASNYSYDNPATAATGLVLDGPNYATNNQEWRGKLVNLEGYALPENIRIFTHYDYGYEVEMENYTWSTNYTYDPATGEIWVKYAPTGATTTLVIRADGVESEGNPAGAHSGETYTRPDSTYGPFDWAITDGFGELTTEEGVVVGYETRNVAYYTPSQPGISYLTATSRDGQYSLNFAVVCEPVKATSLDVDTHNLTMNVGDTNTLTAVLTPEPTLEEHQELIWTSFNPDVAAVDENGTVTAVNGGFAYIKVTTKADTTVSSYCIVQVLGCNHANTETRNAKDPTCTEDGYTGDVYCLVCGALVNAGETIPATGHDWGDWNVTVPATCTTDGTETRACKTYGEAETRTIAATGHDWGDWEVTTPATCTADGVETRTCKVCGETETRAIPANSDNCPSAPFTDLDTSSWYHGGVDFVLSNGYMFGVSDTAFHPNGAMTRGQLVAILYRVAGSPEVTGNCPFTDVPTGSYYYKAITWAAQNGIAAGTTATAFTPDASLTREQMAAFFYRYAAKNGCDMAGSADMSKFTDNASINGYARTAMSWAVANGLLFGYEDSTIRPAATATRAQGACILARFCEKFAE